MQSLEIIPVRIADHYAVISEMMRGLHVHEHSLFDKTDAWDNIETSYMRHVMQLQDECDGLCLIAYAGGKPAGFIIGCVEEQDDSRIEINRDREVYITDGYVTDEYRRQGIYRLLNERLEAHYTSMGIRRILRFTLVNNVRMRQFLESEGYVVTRLLYEKWL